MAKFNDEYLGQMLDEVSNAYTKATGRRPTRAQVTVSMDQANNWSFLVAGGDLPLAHGASVHIEDAKSAILRKIATLAPRPVTPPGTGALVARIADLAHKAELSEEDTKRLLTDVYNTLKGVN